MQSCCCSNLHQYAALGWGVSWGHFGKFSYMEMTLWKSWGAKERREKKVNCNNTLLRSFFCYLWISSIRDHCVFRAQTRCFKLHYLVSQNNRGSAFSPIVLLFHSSFYLYLWTDDKHLGFSCFHFSHALTFSFLCSLRIFSSSLSMGSEDLVHNLCAWRVLLLLPAVSGNCLGLYGLSFILLR